MPLRITRVDLNNRNIELLLHGRGGPVWNLVERTAQRVGVFARGFAPQRSGELKRSLFIEMDSRPGSVRAEVSFNAFHSLFPELGTRGPITPRTGSLLSFRESRPGYPDRRWSFSQVRGQRGQNFLYRGLRQGTRTGGQRWSVERLMRGRL
jgi:hypothetical protein